MIAPAPALPTAAEARAHPVLWAMYASEGAYRPARHIWWLSDKIMELLNGSRRFLAISCPPGHSKSELFSKYLTTYLLGTSSKSRVILCSYAESLTLEWSRVGRDILSDHGPAVFGVDVPRRASAKSWDVWRFDPKAGRSKREGYLRAVGRGGSITGKRMELGICDDLVKDDQEARSQAMRDSAWQWFLKVFLTRLTSTGKAVVIQTRWHHDDIIGRLMDRQARGLDSDWEIVNLPAIAEPNDPMGRAVGEPLWPEMFPLAELERIRARDAHTWAALYQGRPTPESGALYKRETFKYAKVFPDHLEGTGKPTPRSNLVAFAVGDLAVVEKAYADHSAFGHFLADLHRGELFLVGLDRGRMDGPALIRRMRTLSEQGYAVHVEKTTWHLHLIQVALSQGIPVRMLEADKDKVARTHPALALFEAGRFFFAEGAPWLPEVESELLQFPSGRHDDVADVVAYGVRVFNTLLGTSAPRAEVPEGEDEGGWWSGSRGEGEGAW